MSLASKIEYVQDGADRQTDTKPMLYVYRQRNKAVEDIKLRP